MEATNYREDYKKLFSAYKANIKPDEQALEQIEALIRKFPFCQSLYVIQSSALRHQQDGFEESLFRASIGASQREELYQTIHHPEKLAFKINVNPRAKEVEKPFEIIPEIAPENVPAEPEVFIPEPEIELENHASEAETLNAVPEADTLNVEPEAEELVPEMQNEPISKESEAAEKSAEESIEADTFLMDSIASADYFTFDNSIADPLVNVPSAIAGQAEPVGNANISAGKSQRISRYNDDKMPYSFLWWLHKTRKEYADTYQPYVDFKLDTTKPIRSVNDELNHQIIENIFHQQNPVVANSRKIKSQIAVSDAEPRKKDESIIEKFIKEDPQIRPMQAEKIDTENKARRSAEDLNDMVSETLARIYIEQMLFDKAIAAYKKLSLKFPEKNAYFADQISKLEKRIN